MKVKEIAKALDPELFGVHKMYLVGSVKDYTAGPASDIDLLVHFRGSKEKKEDLLAWFREWSRTLDRENKERTGYETGGLLDVHIITDQDIEERTSWAAHIDSDYGSAREIPLNGGES
jgi:predicted nucleotidyltransferase